MAGKWFYTGIISASEMGGAPENVRSIKVDFDHKRILR